jgi:transcriptional regulator with XRE-family HTH domain
MKQFTHIGQVFRFVRLSMDMLQREVADISSLSEGYISSLERGDRDPTWSTVQSICAAMGVPVSFVVMLLEGQNEEVKPFLPMVINRVWSKSQE